MTPVRAERRLRSENSAERRLRSENSAERRLRSENRQSADACPGALTLHEAADGPLARVRLPGGYVSATQWPALVAAGGGRLELTSRGNVQLRGVSDADRVAGLLADAGLLPSRTHERVRNIVASPLAGLDGTPDLTALVRALDRGLCARPELAGLPGRFLFAIDSGRGDVAALDADLVYDAAAGAINGACVEAADAIGTLLDRAGEFQRVRGAAWRLSELAPHTDLRESAAPVPRPVGRVGVALVVLAPLGRLDRRQTAWLAGQGELRITPWRSVVIVGGADPAEAAALGFGVDTTSPWYFVSACTGRPGCARALADVQADAAAAAAEGSSRPEGGFGRWPGRTVRWSGCERRCGRPSDTEIDVVATENGYQANA